MRAKSSQCPVTLHASVPQQLSIPSQSLDGTMPSWLSLRGFGLSIRDPRAKSAASTLQRTLLL